MFAEACMGYGEGLNHHAHNALLLCNRAARRCKLGHYEKVVEDCSTALVVRLSYIPARLRRADSNAKMRWEASVEDHEVLIQEIPVDEKVRKRTRFQSQDLNEFNHD
ncbi:hypothetical protein OPV22_032103 [Ensete ventricosum]|uniref:Uncharacterized protein n=1 Tax=Ensete ventricosum TaxID=4639 RepID=A0AAV8PVP1_ENSVE|nr:hypothetical protein OPV22_032103 [Ensete ventricosum]